MHKVLRTSIILASILTTAARAQIGVLHPLPLPQGGDRMLSLAMSSDQSSIVVCSLSNNSPYTVRGVVHRVDSAVSIELGTIGAPSTLPILLGGVGNDGTAAFWGRYDINNRAAGNAFASRDGSTVAELPQLPAGTALSPNAAFGTTIIGDSTDASFRTRAVAWTANNGSFLLAEPVGGTSSSAQFFTADGHAWGSVTTATSAYLARWTITGNTSTVDLIFDRGAGFTAPYFTAASANASIFFGSRFTTNNANGPRRPLRMIGGTLEMLPVPAGYDNVATGLCSPDGTEVSIVARQLVAPFTTDMRIWSQSHGLETHTQYLTRRGADLTGWTNVSIWSGALGGTRLVGSGILTGPDRTAFYVDLLPTCRADLANTSGQPTPDNAVTIDDLLFFLTAFELGTTAADLDDGSLTGNIDGATTIDDLLFFLTRFETGC